MIRGIVSLALIAVALAANVPEALKQTKPLYNPSKDGQKATQNLRCYDRAGQTGTGLT